MDNQNPVSTTQQSSSANPSEGQSIEQVSPSKNNWSKWIFALVVVVVVLGISGLFLLNKKTTQSLYLAPKNNSSPTATIAVIPTVQPTAENNSLNPNSGNLYTDIKTKLNQVIK